MPTMIAQSRSGGTGRQRGDVPGHHVLLVGDIEESAAAWP